MSIVSQRCACIAISSSRWCTSGMPTLKKGHGTAPNVVTSIPFSTGKSENNPSREKLKLLNLCFQSCGRPRPCLKRLKRCPSCFS